MLLSGRIVVLGSCAGWVVMSPQVTGSLAFMFLRVTKHSIGDFCTWLVILIIFLRMHIFGSCSQNLPKRSWVGSHFCFLALFWLPSHVWNSAFCRSLIACIETVFTPDSPALNLHTSVDIFQSMFNYSSLGIWMINGFGIFFLSIGTHGCSIIIIIK